MDSLSQEKEIVDDERFKINTAPHPAEKICIVGDSNNDVTSRRLLNTLHSIHSNTKLNRGTIGHIGFGGRTIGSTMVMAAAAAVLASTQIKAVKEVTDMIVGDDGIHRFPPKLSKSQKKAKRKQRQLENNQRKQA